MLLPIYIQKYYSNIKYPKYLPRLKTIQTNKNSEYLSKTDATEAGGVRLAAKDPVASTRRDSG
jgi:hypothetical protein